MTHSGQHYPVQYYQPAPPAVAPYRDPADSVGSWMLTIFLLGLPLVGLVYLLVVAFGGSTSESKQNFARAALIWQLIGIVLSVVAIIFFAASGAALFSWLSETSTSYSR